MANKVPLFHQKVQESTGKMTSTAGVAPSASQAPHHDFSGFGRGLKKVAGIIGKIQKGREELKHEADLSDYEVSHRELEYNIEEWKQEAQKGDNPIPYNELQKEIVEPAWADFAQELDGKGYSDAAKRKIMQRYDVDRRASLEREQAQRIKIEDRNNALKVSNHMMQEINDGNEGEADRLFNILSRVEGEGVAFEHRSKALYERYADDIRTIKELMADGTLTDQQGMEQLEALRIKAKDDEFLGPRHSPQIDKQFDATISNHKTKRGNIIVKSNNSVFEAREKGNLDQETLNKHLLAVGPDGAEAFVRSNQAYIQQKKNTDKDALLVWNVIQNTTGDPEDFVEVDVPWPRRDIKGRITGKKAIELIKEDGGSFGLLGLQVLNLQMAEAADRGEAVDIYGSWVDGVTLLNTPQTADLVNTMSFYMNEMEDGQGAFIKEKIGRYTEWIKNPEDKTYEDIHKELFGEDAKRLIQRKTAPQLQQPKQKAPDQYKAGDEVTGSDGKQYKKREDGKWQQL